MHQFPTDATLIYCIATRSQARTEQTAGQRAWMPLLAIESNRPPRDGDGSTKIGCSPFPKGFKSICLLVTTNIRINCVFILPPGSSTLVFLHSDSCLTKVTQETSTRHSLPSHRSVSFTPCPEPNRSHFKVERFASGFRIVSQYYYAPRTSHCPFRWPNSSFRWQNLRPENVSFGKFSRRLVECRRATPYTSHYRTRKSVD